MVAPPNPISLLSLRNESSVGSDWPLAFSRRKRVIAEQTAVGEGAQAEGRPTHAGLSSPANQQNEESDGRPWFLLSEPYLPHDQNQSVDMDEPMEGQEYNGAPSESGPSLDGFFHLTSSDNQWTWIGGQTIKID